jgi:hypothetical protein
MNTRYNHHKVFCFPFKKIVFKTLTNNLLSNNQLKPHLVLVFIISSLYTLLLQVNFFKVILNWHSKHRCVARLSVVSFVPLRGPVKRRNKYLKTR